MTPRATTSRALAKPAPGLPGWVLLGSMLITLGLPALGALRDVTLYLFHGDASPEGVGPIHDGLVIVRTLGYPLAVGLLATALAWPAAWILRGGGRRTPVVIAVLVGPVLLPNYLSFAAFRLAASPMTLLGDALARAPVEVQTGAARVMAVVGLALWAMPIAACVLAAGFGRLSEGVLDQLRVDGAGLGARLRHILQMTWRTQAAAIGLVALVCLGSAVPLHLAQIDTLAQRAWWRLQLAPGGAAWIGAWPLVALALVAGWTLSRLLARPHAAPEPSDPRPSRRAGWLCAGVWTIGTILPMVLLAGSLRTAGALRATWVELGPSVGLSAGVAASTGLAAGLITLLVWFMEARSPGHWVTRVAVFGAVSAAIIPGVLIGDALVSVWALPGLGGVGDWLDRFGGRVALAHLARFAVVPVLIGLALARLEPEESRRTRLLEGAITLGGWWRAEGSSRWGALIGGVLAVAALSLHEIESSVIVSPPGTPSLPAKLLEWLHYNRDEQLSAAALTLMAGGLVVSVLTGWIIAAGAGLRMHRGRTVEPSTPGDEPSY